MAGSRNPAPIPLRAAAGLALAVLLASSALGQTPPADKRLVAITGQSLGGFVLPNQPIGGALAMSSRQAWTWTVEDTQRLLLRGDVTIRLGSFSFSSDEALVWINRLPTASGEVTQIALYFEEATDPTSRAGLGAGGRDLLVTASTIGAVSLRSTSVQQSAPPPTPILRAGAERLAGQLRRLTRELDEGTARLARLPSRDAETPAHLRIDPPPVPGEPAFPPPPPPPPDDPTTALVPRPRQQTDLPIMKPEGTVGFAARDIVVETAQDIVTVSGSVLVDLDVDGPDGPQRVELRAERGVLFLVPGAMERVSRGRRDLSAEDVVGIYLEGGVVATDGRYTLRASKIYYDFAGNRATIVDAILRTYIRGQGATTLYARASEMRQLSANEFEADQATISTSEFFVPHLSIGVERVTITEPPPGVGGPAMIRADDIVFRAGTMPFFFLPGYEGTAEPQPLRGIETGYRDDLGAEILTRWDLLQLMGMAPEGVDAELLAGGYTERGPAGGVQFSLARGQQSGSLDLFGLQDFGGTDRTSSGLDVERPDNTFRGIADGEYQTALSPNVQLQAQLAYITDETFVTTFRRGDFANRREYETSIYLNRVEANTALSFLTSYGLNDYLSNSYLLASRGYQVSKIPELAYRRYADDIFDGILWTQSWSATAMSLRPTSETPARYGIPVEAFGVASPDTDLGQAYFDAGYRDAIANRVSTRHELSLPFAEDNWTFAPFAHASFDGYLEENFDAYSDDADRWRAIMGGGVRGSMRFVKIDDAARSRFFDIRRVRHIIEPNATLWAGYDTLEQGALPIYDQSIEGASGGLAAQVGVRQQWQTQRGGPGAWQSVNFLTIDAGAVINDRGSEFQADDLTNPLQYAQSPIPAFYTFRPELSQWGSHVYGAGSWQISDTLTLAGTGVYLIDDRAGITDPDAVLRNLAKGSIGIEMRHAPDVSSYIEYRYIAPTQSELLQLGVLYRIGKKYLLAFSPQIDLKEEDLRRIQGSLVRTFPDFLLSLNAGYDLIEDQTSVSLSLRVPNDASGGGGVDSSSAWTGFSSDLRPR